MAHIDDSGGGNQKRSANIDVNLVPFIDLMSVLIIFLLITAVWTQVSMIQIGSSIYGKRTDDEPIKPPPRAEIPFRLDILKSGHRVLVGAKTISIPKQKEEYDLDRLMSELKKVKTKYPEKIDAVVTMTDSLEYVNLINGMDALLVTGFAEISIATGGAQ